MLGEGECDLSNTGALRGSPGYLPHPLLFVLGMLGARVGGKLLREACALRFLAKGVVALAEGLSAVGGGVSSPSPSCTGSGAPPPPLQVRRGGRVVRPERGLAVVGETWLILQPLVYLAAPPWGWFSAKC